MASQFVERYIDSGFDGTVNPPWLLVRPGGSNVAYLRSTRYVRTWNISNSNPGAATFKPTGTSMKSGSFYYWEVQVLGHRPGVNRVTVKGDGGETAYLDVQTRTAINAYVNFHFVTDSRGSKTTRNASTVAEMLKKVTRIYQFQANVSFYVYQCRSVTLKLDFGTSTSDRNYRNQLWSTLRKSAQNFDGAADHFNLFCVKTWGVKDRPGIDVVGTNALGGNLGLFEDGADVVVVAHELGHGLGLEHNNSNKKALMYDTNYGGNKIFRNEVQRIFLPTRWADVVE